MSCATGWAAADVATTTTSARSPRRRALSTGYGDSGPIEDIEAKAGDEVVALPPGNVEIAAAVWGHAQPQRTVMSVHDAIERLAYDFLEETHDGWENSDGAYGDFIFDVAERTITLDYNERHMESDYSQHVF
jgi:hypothetical protein